MLPHPPYGFRSIGKARSCLAFVCFAGLLAPACKSAADRALDGESARLRAAIDRVRDAPNHLKREPLKALERLGCQHPLACELHTVCVQGYRLHQRGLDRTARVREQLGGAAPVDTTGLRALLELSESDLHRAAALIEQCGEREGESERRGGS